MNFNEKKIRLEDDGFSDVGFDDHQMMKLKRSERFSKEREREREIKQVVESVKELAQILKELSVLVIDQGTSVDRIDHNIQNVASLVEERAINSSRRQKEHKRREECSPVQQCLFFVLHHACPLDPQRVILVNQDRIAVYY